MCLLNRGKYFWKRSAISEMTLLYIAKNIHRFKYCARWTQKLLTCQRKQQQQQQKQQQNKKNQKNAYASDDTTFW